MAVRRLLASLQTLVKSGPRITDTLTTAFNTAKKMPDPTLALRQLLRAADENVRTSRNAVATVSRAKERLGQSEEVLGLIAKVGENAVAAEALQSAIAGAIATSGVPSP